MPFIKHLDQDFKIENNKIVLNKEYLKANRFRFKKITGTRLSSILNKSEYDTPFKTWTIMVNIFKDTMDPLFANAGNTIEPLIRDYAASKLGCKYLVYNPSAVKWDVFQDNPIFGGIPDGEPINENNQIDYSKFPMIEIKTSSIDALVWERKNGELKLKLDENGVPLIKQKGTKMASWFSSDRNIKIPVNYQYQLGLYMYLRNISKGMFAIAFLTAEDYAHPENFKINDHSIYMVDMFLEDKEAFKKEVDYATEWYHKYIDTGISPIMTEQDKKWLNEQLSNK